MFAFKPASMQKWFFVLGLALAGVLAGCQAAPAQETLQAVAQRPVFSNVHNLCRVYPVDGRVGCLSFGSASQVPPGVEVLDQYHMIADLARYQSVIDLFALYFDNIRNLSGATDTLIACGNGLVSNIELGVSADQLTAGLQEAIRGACQSTQSAHLGLGVNDPLVSPDAVQQAVAAQDQKAAECVEPVGGLVAAGGPQASGEYNIGGLLRSAVGDYVQRAGTESPIMGMVDLGIAALAANSTIRINSEISFEPIETSAGTTSIEGMDITLTIDQGSENQITVQVRTAVEITTDTAGEVTSGSGSVTVETTESDGSKTVTTIEFEINENGELVVTSETTEKFDSSGNPVQPSGGAGLGGDCSMDMDCTSACQDFQEWWVSFRAYCDSVGWADYSCQALVNSAGNCADPGVLMPSPDGNYQCGRLADAELLAQLREAYCEKQQGIMSPIDGSTTACRIATSPTALLGGAVFNICNDPRARPLEDQCVLEFVIFPEVFPEEPVPPPPPPIP